VKSRVRLPGDIIFRLRLHPNLDPANRRLRVSLKHFMQHFTLFPTDGLRCRPHWSVHSLNGSITLDGRTDQLKFVRYCIHQVCPGVVNSLGTPRSMERPDHICTTIHSDGVTQGVNRCVRPSFSSLFEIDYIWILIFNNLGKFLYARLKFE